MRAWQKNILTCQISSPFNFSFLLPTCHLLKNALEYFSKSILLYERKLINYFIISEDLNVRQIDSERVNSTLIHIFFIARDFRSNINHEKFSTQYLKGSQSYEYGSRVKSRPRRAKNIVYIGNPSQFRARRKLRLSWQISFENPFKRIFVGALIDASDNWEPLSSTFFSTWIKYIHIDSHEHSGLEKDYFPSERHLRSVGRPSSFVPAVRTERPGHSHAGDIRHGVVYTFSEYLISRVRSPKWDSALRNVSSEIKNCDCTMFPFS